MTGRPRVFDARKIEDTGIGRYIRGVLPQLLAQDPEHEYAVLLPPGAAAPWDSRARVRVVRDAARNYSLGELLRVPLRLAALRPALVHEPHYAVPLVSAWPSVVTIQDLIHLKFPAPGRSRAADLYARTMFRRAIASDRIIVTSQSTRHDVTSLLGADPARVRVTPLAADPVFLPTTDLVAARATAARYRIAGEFFLYVGMWKPHKNVPILLRAFADLVASGAWSGQLAIVGKPDPNEPEIPATIRALGLEDRVVRTGLVPDADLVALYGVATAVVLPSSYEGFGLTALEGLACGAPVIASAVSSIPEVVGDAGLLVPPGDHAALVRAMGAVAGDAELRQRLAGIGPVRAAKFSWDATARATLAVYAELEPR
jgi:glycosyltransferase involved in cell wall biosynthesis